MDAIKKAIYEQTVKRLERGGIKDPTSQIIALSEEIEMYRDKIYELQERVDRNQRAPETVKVEAFFYDKEEIHENCTVQVLTNTKTGDVSVGWWK